MGSRQTVKSLVRSILTYIHETNVVSGGIKTVQSFKCCINNKTRYENNKDSDYEELRLIQIEYDAHKWRTTASGVFQYPRREFDSLSLRHFAVKGGIGYGVLVVGSGMQYTQNVTDFRP